mgnify:CR=1 FL=1
MIIHTGDADIAQAIRFTQKQILYLYFNSLFEIRCRIAYFATQHVAFALAESAALSDIRIAFQASSPKNFQGSVGNDRAFFLDPFGIQITGTFAIAPHTS